MPKASAQPHFKAVVAFLKQFTYTPVERELWREFRRWTRPDDATWPLVEKNAAAEKLAPCEYLYRDALKMLQVYCRKRNIPYAGGPAPWPMTAGSPPAGAGASAPPAAAITAADRNQPVAAVLVLDPRREKRARVKGKDVQVTWAQWDVLAALVQAGADGLHLDSLIRRSGRTDARGILKRLAAKSDWTPIVGLAGEPGAGYRLNIPPEDFAALMPPPSQDPQTNPQSL